MSKWKVNKITRRYKGDSRTVETTPSWLSNAYQDLTGKSKSAYESGDLSKVAEASDLQTEAWSSGIGGVRDASKANQAMYGDQAARLKSMAETGGAEELKGALALDIGMGESSLGNQFGGTGTLGSYRHNLASATSADAAKAKFAQQVIQNKSAAEKALGENASGASADASNLLKSLEATGAGERAVDQSQLDANWQGLQRYASSIYSNPARQQQTQGGK